MSDDRFKQARRSLINRQSDGDGDQEDAGNEQPGGGEDDFADEKTMLVDLDSLQGSDDSSQQQSGSGSSASGSPSTPPRRPQSRNQSRNQSQNRNQSRNQRRNRQSKRGRQTPQRRNRPQDRSSSQNQQSQQDQPNKPSKPNKRKQRNRRQRPNRSRQNQQRQQSQQHRNRSSTRRSPRGSGTPSGNRGRSGPSSGPSQTGQAQTGQPRTGQSHTASDTTDALDQNNPGGVGDDSTRPQPTHGGAQLSPPQSSVHQEASLDDVSGGAGASNQVFVPGDDEGAYDEKTAFVNLNDFADQEPENTTFSPETNEAGYEGNTQFVDINSLVGSEDAASPGPADADDLSNDEVLRQGYSFDQSDVHRGAITRIHAENALGKSVILRQIWAGPAREMPSQMRQRINELDKIDIDHLCSMNGMVISQTGCWAEVERPQGERMTRIIERQGAQEEKRVLDWISQIGNALHTLHDEYELVYGNLTPDAVWIDEEGNATLEPFDMVCLEDRDDLGPYGPPELKVHPDSRTLSPATDVYCLAAVTLAGLTGVPLDPRKVGAIDSKRVTNAVRDAVIDAPRERTQTVRKFLDRLVGSDFSLSGFIDDLDLDIDPGRFISEKLRKAEPIHMAMAVLMVGLVGVGVYATFFTGGPPPTPPGGQNAAAADGKGGENSGGKPIEDVVTQAPGAFQTDPRVTIRTSFRQNPPEDAEKKLSGAELQAKIDELRSKAQDKIKEAEDMDDTARRDKLKEALKAVTRAVRLQEEMTATDRKLFEKLYAEESIQEYHTDVIKRLEKNLETGSISEARFPYRQLAAISPEAKSEDFFLQINSANVTSIDRKKSEDANEQE